MTSYMITRQFNAKQRSSVNSKVASHKSALHPLNWFIPHHYQCFALLHSINFAFHDIIVGRPETDNSISCTITVRVDNDNAKSSCAPPNQYKAMLCIKKVVRCQPPKYCIMHPWPCAPPVYAPPYKSVMEHEKSVCFLHVPHDPSKNEKCWGRRPPQCCRLSLSSSTVHIWKYGWKTRSALDLIYPIYMAYQSENTKSCGRFLSLIGQKRLSFHRNWFLHS